MAHAPSSNSFKARVSNTHDWRDPKGFPERE